MCDMFCLCVCVCVCVCTCMYVCVCLCVGVCVCVQVWGDTPDPLSPTTCNARTYLQPQLNKAVLFLRVYIYIHMHIYTYIYIHINHDSQCPHLPLAAAQQIGPLLACIYAYTYAHIYTYIYHYWVAHVCIYVAHVCIYLVYAYMGRHPCVRSYTWVMRNDISRNIPHQNTHNTQTNLNKQKLGEP